MLDKQTFLRNDPNFVRDLLASVPHVETVGEWLRKMGYDVKTMPLRIAPNLESMWDYSDNGDIYIHDKRIEVKQRKLDFDSLATFPYPSVMVDVAHTFDNAKVKPYAYILTNKATTGALVVLGETYPRWKKIEKFDRYKGRTRIFYDAPLDTCEYYSLENFSQKIFDFAN